MLFAKLSGTLCSTAEAFIIYTICDSGVMPTIESYFSCSSTTKTLPDPDGPLAKKLKAETIVNPIKEVAALSSASGPQAKGKRGPYKKFQQL